MSNSVPADPSGVMPLAPKPGRRYWRRVLMALLIFLGGAACGAAVATMAMKHGVHHGDQGPHSISSHITSRLADMLDLTDDQAAQVREIILRRHNALVDIRRDIQPRLEVELAVLEKEIAAVLNEQQRVKWHAHAADIRSHWLPPIPEGPSGR
jgi:hypothetical protein